MHKAVKETHTCSRGCEQPVASPIAVVSSLSPPSGGDAAEMRSTETKEEKLSIVSLGGRRDMGVAYKGSSLPPALNVTPRWQHRYRFRANSTASGVTVTLGNILAACGSTCTVANTTVRSWASSVRVKRFMVWLPGNLTNNYCYIDWVSAGASGFLPDDARIVTVPDGITVTTALSFSPPKLSLAGSWLNPTSISASTVVFGITCGTGSIIDMDIEATLSNVGDGVSATITAGTLAKAYYLPLDGVGTNVLRAIGVPTTS